ncbi:pentatricopeptide repeat-containing protein At3g13160, mitochondrial-like [Lolium rigidum]|uniref:pentatricopeptide repeat-containing protein At3g13160, mitochondrial-like n=1 Tax=Lolium rigidum TaxID=89674 RepID=UPI001F5DF464|nr:pentatricopeptide repeat-containing protein At3g13160, mitochondrial-like [Lolium rigidum]
MASHAAAAAAAAASTRANTLSRIFASSSPTPPPNPSPKIKRALTQKPPAADAHSIAAKKPPKHLGAQPAADAPGSDKLPKSYRTICKDLFRQRDPDKLVSEFVQASAASSRFRGKHHLYKAAVSRLASSGRQDGIQAILDAQKRFLEASTEAFAARLIRLYGRASMPSHAVAAFHELPAKHKSTGTFNAVLAACDEGGDFDAVAAAFQEIPASHPSVAPNAYSYNVLIRALCKKPDLAAALEAVSLMEKHGVSPDTICFSTLLNGFYKHGRMDDAETVWDMMKERNLEPDAKCYNAKLRGLVAAGRIEDAAAVVERLEKDGPKPDTVSYNELIRGYCKAGRLQDAKKLYDDLIKNECAPNKGTYGTLLPLLLQAGELDCALRYCHDLLSSKRTNGVECGLLQDVVNALIEASRVEEATKLVELGKKKYYLRKGLRMPHTAQDNEVIAETDEEESISEEKVL